MCNYYLINELSLGTRNLGFEFIAISDKKSEVVEMTAKTVRDNIKAGKNIHGFQLAENGNDLVLDEKFFMRNYTVKTHINNIRPKYEYDGQCVANIMYIVVGSHEENGKTVYDVISSRVERTTFSEEKLKAMYDLGFISGGCKIEDDKVILPSLETKPIVEEPNPIPVEKVVEQPKTVEQEKKMEFAKSEPKEPTKPEVKEQEKKTEPPKQEVKEQEKKSELTKVAEPKKVPTVTKSEQKPIKK